MDTNELVTNRAEIFVLTKRELAAVRRRESTEGASLLLATEIEKAVSAHREATKKLVEATDLMIHMRGRR